MTHIKIGDVSPRIAYTATEGQTDYPFTFPIFQTSDLKVAVNGVTLSSGFTVTGGTTTDALGVATGAQVTLDTASTVNDTVVLWRETVISRLSDYSESGDLRANTLNTDLDRLTVYAQEQSEQAERMLSIPASDSFSGSTELPSASARAEKILAFDSDGAPVVSSASLTELESAASVATSQAATATQAAIEADADRVAAETARTEAETARDAAISAAASVTNPLPRDGSQAMAGTLDMGANSITNVSALSGDAVASQTEVSTATAGDKLMSYTRTAEAIAALVQGGGYIGTYTFETSQDFVKANYPDFSKARITAIGGGGGGGGSDTYNSGHETSAAGGSGGGTAISTVLFENLAASETITIGAAGAGGTQSGGHGGDGGQTSFGSHAVADGGLGGRGTGANANMYIKARPVRGGDATTGDILIGGGASAPSDAGGYGGNHSIGGTGGSSTHGGGGVGGFTQGTSNTQPPTSGLGYGSGGGGGADTTTSGQAGASGAQGIVIVELFA